MPHRPAVTAPTGDEFLESLRDGREIWIHGERVDDVTKHPAFANSARSIASLYDALRDPAHADTLLRPTDTGNGGLTHAAFLASRTRDDLRAGRDASRVWAELTFGWIGRTPDYKSGMLSALGADPEWYGEFAENARTWYRRGQEEIPYLGHAVVSPPIDRGMAPEQVRDIVVHVERETDAGIVVSGAKVVATGAPLTHGVFVSHLGPPVKDRATALTFIAMNDTPGIKLLARTSYEQNAGQVSGPFDYPLSSRFDENDAILVFDRALIPWENVLIYDVQRMADYYEASGWAPRALIQSATRMAVKLEFLIGLTHKALLIKGGADAPPVRTALGEMIALRNAVSAIADGMIERAVPNRPGTGLIPNQQYGSAYAALAPHYYRRVKEIIETVVASGLIYLNSSVADFAQPEVSGYLDRFLRGSGDISALERSKTMKMLWDAVGTEFGGRNELYELNYFASSAANYTRSLSRAEESGALASYAALADAAMADYDEKGWTRR